MHYPLSDHYDGTRFFNPGGMRVPTLRDVLRWKRTSQPSAWPKWIDVTRKEIPVPPPTGVQAIWINHSTFLLRMPDQHLLLDPVFSDRCGPFGFVGPHRVHAPGIPLGDLPHIDAVLLSHDHYDHCDLPSLRQLALAHQPLAITPLGNGNLLRRAGFTKIIELDWWQAHQIGESLEITVTPAQHWSNRLSGHRCERLWGGFFIRTLAESVFFAGDTGYHPQIFKEIFRRLARVDLALIPIGAYEPRWFMKGLHCNPGDAVQIHCDLSARRSVAMHWGTFQLTDEGREAPLQALRSALESAQITHDEFQAIEPGETVSV